MKDFISPVPLVVISIMVLLPTLYYADLDNSEVSPEEEARMLAEKIERLDAERDSLVSEKRFGSTRLDTIWKKLPKLKIRKRHVDKPDKMVEAAVNGRVKIRMTEELAIEAWGEPTTVNRTLIEDTVKEQWVYSNGSVADRKYLYIRNGEVSKIQQ